MSQKHLLLSLFTSALLPFAAAAAAEERRPSAPRLLPEKTLAYIRVADVPELREGVRQSGLGRMLSDEQMRPLVGDLYSGLAELFEQISDRVGVSLDELLSIPQGEMALALVPLDAPPSEEEAGPRDDSPDAIRQRIEARQNRSPVGVVGLIETGDKTGSLMRVIDRLEDQLRGSNFQRSTRSVGGDEIVTFTRGDRMPFAYAERNGTVVFGFGPRLIDDLLKRWTDNGSDSTLAQNLDFGNVMSHCVGAEATRPQITFYADPYHLAERLVKANGGFAAVVWPILENLKLEKLRGIGGSSFFGGENEFESILHLHVLLDSPRDGALSIVRPGKGPIQPEDWVPADVISYTTLHWDLLKTYEGVDRIVSGFQGDGAMERIAEKPFKDRTGLDLRADILEQLTGRVGIVRWAEPPIRLNSATQSWAVEVEDAAKFQPTLEKLLLEEDRWKKELYSGLTLYTNTRVSQGNIPSNIRRPEPTIALVGNYVIGSDSRKAIEHIIQTRGGAANRLADSPDYALISGEISGKLDSETPFLFSYLRTEEIFRQFYELAKAPNSRRFLKQAGENNRAARMLVEALEKNELPAFSAFSKYFAPSGAFAYDDPTGVHYASFTLKPLE